MTDFVPSDLRVMRALAVILPQGTNVATTAIDSGIAIATAALPAIEISIPDDERNQTALGSEHGWTHQAVVSYYDSWVTSSRTYQELKAATRTALNVMCQNLGDNPRLVVDGASAGLVAGARIRRHIGPPQDMTNQYGFWLISAYLVVTVVGIYELYIPD